ncbi:hypothetical protein LEP1GSC125_1137 [Leptospira mayottensis 200901122]|uniref:Uncharacterized protein n=1 Tax=Leptospira mayottensis 200901122 TaxID=1193010 RepID=A0AA87SXR0_9LEPT|nr:hypothetical protein LEP1GSC125_1137 [Leptospira mayottensis 200901122]
MQKALFFESLLYFSHTSFSYLNHNNVGTTTILNAQKRQYNVICSPSGGFLLRTY